MSGLASSLPCLEPDCDRVYRSRKALNQHRRKEHGAVLRVRPDRKKCSFVAAALPFDGGLVCPGCLQRFATRSSLVRHLSGQRRRPPLRTPVAAHALALVRPTALPARAAAAARSNAAARAAAFRFRASEAARPQRARLLQLVVRPAAPGSSQHDVSIPLRLVGLRTARREAAALCRMVVVESAGLSVTVSSDGAPAVSLHEGVLLLVRSSDVGGKAVPTTFTLEEGDGRRAGARGGAFGFELVSAATLPENMLEAA